MSERDRTATGPVKGEQNLRKWSPSGDLGQRDDESMKDAFPHPIKNSGKDLVSSEHFATTVKTPGEYGEAQTSFYKS